MTVGCDIFQLLSMAPLIILYIISQFNDIAASRGQKLSQMALSWVLREGKVTTVLIGASRPEQIKENVEAVYKLDFTQSELSAIDAILSE